MYLILFLIICCAFLPTMFCNNCLIKPRGTCRNTAKVCNKICDQGFCEIRAAVILPNDTNLAVSSLPRVMPLLERAINDAYKLEILPKWINIKLIGKDDHCDASFAQIATIDSYSDPNCFHVIFGPVCDYCLAAVSRIVKFFDTPLLTAGGFSNDFDKDKKNCDDEYFMLVRTGKLVFKGLSQFFKRIFVSYGWSKVAFLYDKQGQREVAGENTCSLMMQTMAEELRNVSGFQYKDGDLGLSTFSIKDFLMKEIGHHFGIILICASRNTVHEILLAAAELDDMVYRGEYIFFNIELTNRATDPDQPWIEENIIDFQRTNKLKDAYKNLKILTSLSEEVYNNITNTTTIHEKSNYTSGFYDAMILYLKTIKEFIHEGGPENNQNITINGYDLVCNMYNQKFTGLNGEVIINSNGDRLTHYSLLSYNPQRDKFDIVENYTFRKQNENEMLRDRKNYNIYWHNNQEAPPDTPTCGYDNSKCKVFSPFVILIISSVILLFAIVVSIIGNMYYKNYQLNKTLERTYWKINQKDFIDLLRGSNQTLDQENANKLGVITCKYKNKITRLKIIPDVLSHNFSRTELLHLNEMLDLHHENLVKFIGISTDSSPNYVLTEYCSKGSLEDLLKDENMAKIISESIIQKSFIKDIIFGMHYLHQSELKSHGALTSANCLVDNRLAVKITDFGLQFLYKRHERGDEHDTKYWQKMLYKAPELLKYPSHNGTQKGDVYSFAIIVHEMLERSGIFFLGEDVSLSPKGIVHFYKILNKSG